MDGEMRIDVLFAAIMTTATAVGWIYKVLRDQRADIDRVVRDSMRGIHRSSERFPNTCAYCSTELRDADTSCCNCGAPV